MFHGFLGKTAGHPAHPNTELNASVDLACADLFHLLNSFSILQTAFRLLLLLQLLVGFASKLFTVLRLHVVELLNSLEIVLELGPAAKVTHEKDRGDL